MCPAPSGSRHARRASRNDGWAGMQTCAQANPKALVHGAVVNAPQPNQRVTFNRPSARVTQQGSFQAIATPAQATTRGPTHGGRADSRHTDVTFEARLSDGVGVARGDDPAGRRRHGPGQHRDGLPDPVRAAARAGRHAVGVARQRLRLCPTHSEPDDEGRRRYRQVFTSRLIEAEHPVVQLHPETGERALILGHFVKAAGLQRPRQRAPAGRAAGARNQAGEHRALVVDRGRRGDLGQPRNAALRDQRLRRDAQRIVRRATVAGEPGTGVDGQRSRVVGQARPRASGLEST